MAVGDVHEPLTSETAQARLRAGMVGRQGGCIHRAALRLANRFDLVAGAFSSDPQTCLEAGEALGIPVERNYLDFRDMASAEAARDDPIDVAIVVTANHLHFEPCKLFLEADIHVICDKPLVNSSDEARELQRLAEANDTFFAVTYTYTGYPMVRDARARIRAGRSARSLHVCRISA